MRVLPVISGRHNVQNYANSRARLQILSGLFQPALYAQDATAGATRSGAVANIRIDPDCPGNRNLKATRRYRGYTATVFADPAIAAGNLTQFNRR